MGRLGVGAVVAKPVMRADLAAPLLRMVSGSRSAGPPDEGVDGPVPTDLTPDPEVPEERAARRRILVVEDNTTNQMVAMGLLSKLGFDAEVVSDGRQAVDAVARTTYAIVLMDCNMPVMDGYEATAAIRRMESDGAGAHVPIVAMTASALVGDRERCLAAGMDDYVSKPVKLADLGQVLSRWATPAPTGPTSAVQEDQLASLRTLDGGDGVFLTTLVRSFLASSTEALHTLAAAVAADDADALNAEAHRFKGEAVTLGAAGVAALCAELEAMPAPLDRAAAGAVLERAEREMVRVRERLQEEFGPAPVP
jgi:CheY-like chemotaxis protein/HPt (histidine-containing phosphotransfer) domain-containing protein